MQKYIMEFIGTFFLVFAIGNVAISPGAGSMAPLAIGATLMAMIFAGGHISMAHYNPAVTLAFVLRGKCKQADVPGYLVGQVLGAVLASFVVLYLKGNPDLNTMSLEAGPTLLVEFLGTFALVFVILNVATTQANQGNSFYGLAIAVTVIGLAYSVGSISGGAFNPAVALALIVMGVVGSADIWLYLLAHVIAAFCATYTFFYLVPDKK
ncbi:MAG: aquaporin [Verrucomicrobiota bacterium]